jgi:hypothetical protein
MIMALRTARAPADHRDIRFKFLSSSTVTWSTGPAAGAFKFAVCLSPIQVTVKQAPPVPVKVTSLRPLIMMARRAAPPRLSHRGSGPLHALNRSSPLSTNSFLKRA